MCLETLGKVYGHDAVCTGAWHDAGGAAALPPKHSGPVMEELASLAAGHSSRKRKWSRTPAWVRRSPICSDIGKGLTAFLREANAPLDNNLCERGLKSDFSIARTALFYKTLNGAQVGDLFMSLIHTCELVARIHSTT